MTFMKKVSLCLVMIMMITSLNCCGSGHAPGPDPRGDDKRQVNPDPGPDPGARNPGEPAPDAGKGGGGKK